MDTVETSPQYGHIWTNRATGKRCFVERVEPEWVYYHYVDCIRRNYFCSARKFKKKFEFNYVFA